MGMRGARVMATAAVLALGLSLAACGDDDDDAATEGSATEGTAPEDVRASDAEVATGLQQIDDLGDEVASAVADGDDDGAVEANEQIEPAWFGVEGTVKANDEDVYLTFEDNFATLGMAVDEGDAEGAQTAADTVSETVSAYLADHPG
jgi:hypothetical protein